MDIRKLNSKDWKELRIVASESWHNTYKNILDKKTIDDFIDQNYSKKATQEVIKWAKRNDGINLVITENEKITGFATVGKDKKEWRLWRIYLLPNLIGRGLGSKLLNEVEEHMRDKGAQKYFCFVHNKNKLGINFYKRKGFEHIEQKDIDDEWYMEKEL